MTDIFERLGLPPKAVVEDAIWALRERDIRPDGWDWVINKYDAIALLTALEQRGYRRGIEEAADIVEEMICGDYDKEEVNKLKRGVPYCHDVPRVIRELLRAGEGE